MNQSSKDNDQTHFGYQQVPKGEKASKVRQVFDSVADQYDIMNDLMSMGVHRLWKRFAIDLISPQKGHFMNVLPGDRF